MRKLDRFYWPIMFALLGFILGGASWEELIVYTLSGASVGVVVSVLLVNGADRGRANLGVNIVAGLLWALVVFLVGFFDLRRAGESLAMWPASVLVAISLAPLILFVTLKGLEAIRARNSR